MVVPFRISCAIFVACFALASAWADDYILLTKGDSGDETSFYDSARWLDRRSLASRVPVPRSAQPVTRSFWSFLKVFSA